MTREIVCRRLVCGFLVLCLLLSALLTVAASAAEAEAPLLAETAAEMAARETIVPQMEETVSETTLPTEAAETEPAVPAEAAPVFLSPYSLYFGLLHAHTNLSDGLGTVEEAFSHAAAVENLDFFAVTDHSNSFDNAKAGSLLLDGSTLSTEWAAGKAAAEAVTSEEFLGIFGFEMTWPEIRQLGHITTCNTPGWLSRDKKGFSDDPDALAHYFEALAQVPGSISQFCHPGDLYGDFDRFDHYRADYDNSVHLLETLGEGSISGYIQALDQCWHLAPTATQNNHNGNWGSENGLRTVVLADSLTEDALFSAIREYRVYATEDADLHISFELDGHIMGSRLSRADDPEITVSLYDPTDTGGCTLEIITEGGISLTKLEAEGNGDLAVSVPGGFRWYFVKVTQADGDVAVTAPVWVEGFENMGILSFAPDTDVPIQGRSLALILELYNDEPVDFLLESLELYVNDAPVHHSDTPGTVPAGDALVFSVPYTHPDPGAASFRVVVRGTVLGQRRGYEQTLSLRYRPGETVTGLLIDGSHGNSGLDCLNRVKELAREAGMTATVFTDAMPMGGDVLLIPPLGAAPEAGFLEDAVCFLENGGSLILLADGESGSFANDVLETVGSALRVGEPSVPEGSTKRFNTASGWWDTLSEEQFFLHGPGCALEPDRGQWLVKDSSGSHILLACEQTPWGGTVFAAGTAFLLDGCLPEGKSVWDHPGANQTLLQSIFGTAQPLLTEVCIGEARWFPEGTLCRVRGYVTAGTSDPNTTFPDTIYIQDDTGGIAVAGFSVPDIQIGTSMELIGVLEQENGLPLLRYTDHRLTEERSRYLLPRSVTCEVAGDYSLHGGELVQIEGTVTARTLTADGKGVSRLTVKDYLGDTAVIEIEDVIRSGSTGKNTLAKQIKKGRTVRVTGLLHINSAGETVIRVRDCEEVVYIPPEADPTNPKTADRRFGWMGKRRR